MWLKEKEFSIRLGGSLFIDIAELITFNGESLFTVRRHEDNGDVAIDCEIYEADGGRVASVKRNNVYRGDKSRFDTKRTDDRITLKDRKTDAILVDIKKREAASPVELDVSLKSYLPDGRILDLGPNPLTSVASS